MENAEAASTADVLARAEQTLQQLQELHEQCAAVVKQQQKATAAAEEEEPAFVRGGKRRKVALYMAYNGHGYHGMQFNQGVPTIENTLEDAIVKAGGIAKDHQGTPSNVKWMRAARTDKGVSAIGQVVSLMMFLKPEGVVERINENLPEQIKVFGYRRATGSFNARTDCDQRRYEYSLPEWVFDPNLFPHRPSWRPSSHTLDGFLKEEEPDTESCTALHVDGRVMRVRKGFALNAPPTDRSFVFDDECRARLNSILGRYVGTHNFHNYSPAVQATQMAAQRHILSFQSDGVFTIGEGDDVVRWVRTEVVGDSFLLNQIRNMVGMAVAVYRGTAPEDGIEMALDPNRDFTTPLAPDLGLFLRECIFDNYNRVYGKDRELLSITDWQEEVEAFTQKWIYPRLAERDRKDGVNYNWLVELTDERYLFSKWEHAKPVRNEKRPRTKEQREAAREQIRIRESRITELINRGLPKRDAVQQARQEAEERALAAKNEAEDAADYGEEASAKKTRVADDGVAEGATGTSAGQDAPASAAAAAAAGAGRENWATDVEMTDAAPDDAGVGDRDDDGGGEARRDGTGRGRGRQGRGRGRGRGAHRGRGRRFRQSR